MGDRLKSVCMVSTPDEPDCGIGVYTGELRRHLNRVVDVDHVALPKEAGLIGALRTALVAGYNSGDVVHVQHEYGIFGPKGVTSWLFFPVLWILTRLRGSPIVITIHEAWSRDTIESGPVALKYVYVLAMNRLLVAVADRLVFLSEAVETEFERTVTVTDDIRFPHGVVPDRHSGPVEYDFEYDSEDTIIVEPGYVSRAKGQDRFVALAKRCPDLEFLIAGGAQNERNEEFIEELNASLPENVRISGILNEEAFHDVFRVADAVVLPYRKSSQSGVFNLCATYEVPVAGSDCEYFQTLAKVYDCLELFPGGDIDAMERATIQVLDPDRRTELIDGLRDFREAESFEMVAERHVDLYRQLVED